jgi:group I intron endonuclease
MKFNYEGNSLKSGIYQILNTHTNRVYIGQASRFKERWCAHQSGLRTGKHQNRFLLNDFRKCFAELKTTDFLEFYVLEVMEGSTKEQRNRQEEAWIQANSEKRLYNADLKPSVSAKTWSKTPNETALKRSRSMQGPKNPNFGKTFDKEYRRKLSEAHKGIQAREKHPMFGKHHSDDTKRLIAQSLKNKQLTGSNSHNAKTYGNIQLLSPDGELIMSIECLTEFCKTHNLQSANLCRVLNGQRQSHKGWRRVGPNNTRIQHGDLTQ